MVIGWKTITSPAIAVPWLGDRTGLWSVIARRHDIGADRALVAAGTDRRDAEDVVVDVLVRQHELGDVADVQLVLPVGRPGLAPEDPVAGGARRAVQRSRAS